MDSVLRQLYAADETNFDFNQGATYGIDTGEFPFDLAGIQKSTEGVSDVKLKEKDWVNSASLPITSDFGACQPDHDFLDHQTAPFNEPDLSSSFPVQDISDPDVDYELDQEALNQWCETLSSKSDNSSMFQSVEQSLSAVTNQYTSTSNSPHTWEEAWCNAENTFPAYGSPVSNGQTPDLTYCSTPISRTTSEGTSSVTEARSNDFKTDNQRWHATQIRSRAADSSFLYGVLTTKIFCRPSCASRRASRRNVKFFPFPGAIEAAERAKLRACKRCKPELLGTVNAGVLGVCQVLRTIIAETQRHGGAETKETLKLDSLALSAGLSTFHFHRLFKATTQLTPSDFIHACRSFALQDALGQDNHSESGKSVDTTQLIKDSSCWSPRTARKALGGISPSEYAKGALPTNVQYCYGETACGRLCVLFSGNEDAAETRVHAVLLGPDAETRASLRFPRAKEAIAYHDHLDQCLREIAEEARDRDTELTADVLPTLWRARVWLRLMQH